MKLRIDLEDTFGDIVGKASRGTRTSIDRLSERTGIDRSRLEQLLGDKAQPTDAEARAVAEALELNPEKLADSGQRRWYPADFHAPNFLQHQINRPHPSNGYFLILPDARVGAFVDPAGQPSPIINAFKESQVALQYILLTHKHYDHTDALAQVRKAFPSAKPVIHELDAGEVRASARGAIGVRDGDRLPFGDDEIEMIHTPGHTDGSTCFIYKGMIFTGDTLFAGSIGRTNGPHFGYDDHRKNIRSKILSLPEETVVLPGHGPASTVAQERAHNPFF
jgi:hydroxyacylglutathione hydrolase